MLGIYFSGTGNTKHCIETLVSLIDKSAECLPLEDKDITEKIQNNDVIYLGYPTQFSNMPYIVKVFIQNNQALWAGKKVFCVSTMGAFSGDGAGCSARLLKKYGAIILGGLHIRMPDSVCDSKLLKNSLEENRAIIHSADEKIAAVSDSIISGKYPHEGITFAAHICGLFGQRLWFYGKTMGFSEKLRISDACIGCGKCVAVCPMHNIVLNGNRAIPGKQCTMCYRCISLCPKKAITLLGKEVTEQCRFEKYQD